MIIYQTITFDFNFWTEKDTVATTTFSADQGYSITREDGGDSVVVTHIGASAVMAGARTVSPRIEARGDGYTIPWTRVQIAQTVAQYSAFEAFGQARRDRAAGIAPAGVKK